MTKAVLNSLKKALEKTQIELGRGIRNREDLTIETSSDELDRIQAAGERDYAIGNLERNSQRMREVRTALGRFRAGTFGICSSCEESINLKRLAAIPWASLCIVCQGTADNGQEVDAPRIMAA